MSNSQAEAGRLAAAFATGLTIGQQVLGSAATAGGREPPVEQNEELPYVASSVGYSHSEEEVPPPWISGGVTVGESSGRARAVPVEEPRVPDAWESGPGASPTSATWQNFGFHPGYTRNQVSPDFPPPTSSGGYRYYALVAGEVAPVGIYCGQYSAERAFRWESLPYAGSVKGFQGLEPAIRYLLAKHLRIGAVPLYR